MKSVQLNYFQTSLWGDCYQKEGDYKIISFSETSGAFLMVDDENMEVCTGPYRKLKVSENDFNELRDFAEIKKTQKVSNLIKKIHSENKDEINNEPLWFKKRWDIN